MREFGQFGEGIKLNKIIKFKKAKISELNSHKQFGRYSTDALSLVYIKIAYAKYILNLVIFFRTCNEHLQNLVSVVWMNVELMKDR